MNVQEANDFYMVRETLSLKHGHYFIFTSFLFFQFINKLVRSHGPPKSLTRKEWEIWRNLVVSWIHAIIASLWVITCTLVCSELYSDLFQHISHLTFYCVCFSVGYFLYDFMDIFVSKMVFVKWDVIAHHIVVISILYYNVHTKAQIGFSIVALAVEINSVFLHLRKLLQMIKTPYDSPLYIVVKYLNIVSFFLFRGGPMLAITMGCIYGRNYMSTLFFVGLSSSTFFLDILNIILFWRLIKSDILRGRSRTRPRETSVIHKQENGVQNNCNNNYMITSNNNCSETEVTDN